MSLTVSVVMATYKGARFIQNQLASLASQNVLPSELIVTDDRSPDETFTIVEAFARQSPFPVRASVNEQRLGYAGNFMRAAGHARGDLIAFCDQDDVWYPNKLAVMLEHFRDPDVALAEHAFDLVDEAGQMLSRSPHRKGRSVGALDLPTTWHDGLGFTMVFRRVLMSFEDEWHNSASKVDRAVRAGHDEWIGWLAKSLGRTVFDPTPLAGYRQHSANVFGAHAAATERLKSLTNHGYALARFAECMERSQAFTQWNDKASRAVQTNRRFARELMVQGQGNLRSVAQLLLTGAYIRRRWPLGRRALVQDLGEALRLR